LEVVIKIHEGELDQAFAEAFEQSAAMQKWLLEDGRFSRFSQNAKLLANEQAAARKADVVHWSRFWWCSLPDGSQSETDLFFVFDAEGYRFALHIENKPPSGSLSFEQAHGYRRRATFKANTPQWLSYIDFETILLAPQAFIEANREAARQFDRTISYESAARFAPIFADAIRF
jgi:hypothetical protein